MSGRRIDPTRELALRRFDLDGPMQPDISWTPLPYDATCERGSYLMRLLWTRTETGCLPLGLD